MCDVRCDGTCRSDVRQYRKFGLLLLLLGGLIAPTCGALAHGVDHRVERGEAVIVYFIAHQDGPMSGAGFRVFSPDGRTIFASGNTDALGRAVFVPDQAGDWRVLMATEDGHGAEVEVTIEDVQASARAGPAQGRSAPVASRIPATAAGIGYLFGLAGLLVLWRQRR